MRASGAFADIAAQSARTFEPEFDIATTLCHKRVHVDFLQHRLEATLAYQDNMWGKPPYWSGWYTKPIPNSPETWKQHCDRIAQADEVHRRSLEVLSGYADAIKTLAETGGYEGADFSDSARIVGDIARQLVNEPTASTEIKQYVDASAEPVSKVSAFLLEDFASKDLAEALREADPPVHQVLDALRLYVEAANFELRALLSAVNDLLQALDARMKETMPVHPNETIGFYRFAAGSHRQLYELGRRQNAYLQILKDLDDAHAKLKAIGTGESASPRDDQRKLTTVILDAAKQLAEIKRQGIVREPL